MARANATRGLGNYLDLAFICAFDFTLLLEHFLGWLLARTSGGTDVVVKSAFGHGTICSLDHLGFHGLLAFGGLLRHTAHLNLNLDIAFTFTLAFTLHFAATAAI